MISIAFIFNVAMAGPPQPLATTTHSLTLVRPDGIVGELRQITLTSRRYPKRNVNVLSRWARANREERQVLPPSLARSIASEMSGWIKTIGGKPRGLDILGCTRRVGAVRANRRVDLCLDALASAERAKFLDWYRRTANWVE